MLTLHRLGVTRRWFTAANVLAWACPPTGTVASLTLVTDYVPCTPRWDKHFVDGSVNTALPVSFDW